MTTPLLKLGNNGLSLKLRPIQSDLTDESQKTVMGISDALKLLVYTSIFFWGMPYPFFKKPDEMLWIFKSEFIGNLANCFAMIEDFLFGYIDNFILDILLCRFTGFLFN